MIFFVRPSTSRFTIYTNWTLFSSSFVFSLSLCYRRRKFIRKHFIVIKMLTTSKSVIVGYFVGFVCFSARVKWFVSDVRDGHLILFLFHRKFIDAMNLSLWRKTDHKIIDIALISFLNISNKNNCLISYDLFILFQNPLTTTTTTAITGTHFVAFISRLIMIANEQKQNNKNNNRNGKILNKSNCTNIEICICFVNFVSPFGMKKSLLNFQRHKNN